MARVAKSNGGSVPEEAYQSRTAVSHSMNLKAREYLPGGDSRSTIYYTPYPMFFARGEGCYLYDADGNRFLDFTCNHTSLILGYGHPEVKRALGEQIEMGTCFPGPTEPQIRLAQMICERTPSMERVRFANSGTEATMNAIRAARAFTGRPKVVKAEGAFHGTHDTMEISIAPDPQQAGSQDRPIGLQHVEGIPGAVFQDVVIMPFNDPNGARRIIEEHGDEISSVIVEPVMGSAGMIPATQEYLDTLREVTRKLGVLLIFDEVITYRLAPGGAQEYYGVTPDLTCLGKMIGGGLPLGVFGGRADVMALFDPVPGRPAIHHGGSFNANPMSLVAGAATLEQLTSEEYGNLARLGDKLRRNLEELFIDMELPARITGLGSLFGVHLTGEPVNNYRDAQRGNTALRHQIFLGMLNEGIVMDPRGAGCLSVAIGESEIDDFVTTMQRVLNSIDYTNFC
ncbi:MAG: aspartate aminotransferase family protein [Dehalococcoidia bacterium]|nr:aspartate aminotransferase family protein [Dehalococcoidia bacterium]